MFELSFGTDKVHRDQIVLHAQAVFGSKECQIANRASEVLSLRGLVVIAGVVWSLCKANFEVGTVLGRIIVPEHRQH